MNAEPFNGIHISTGSPLHRAEPDALGAFSNADP
jgi:hypothetical protein